jgi:hypothetical protein
MGLQACDLHPDSLNETVLGKRYQRVPDSSWQA